MATRPTESMLKQVTMFIRNGAFPHMAAEAAGISTEQFDAWLARAARPHCPKLIREFAREVRQAQAQARLKAELDVFKTDPKTWLKSGPGRDVTESPGWTTSSPPAPRDALEPNLLSDPAWNELWATILSAVAAFPEARAALADALRDYDTAGRKKS